MFCIVPFASAEVYRSYDESGNVVFSDQPSANAVRLEISEAIKKFIPNLNVTQLTVTPSENDRYAVVVRLDYIATFAAFQSVDFVELEL